MEHYAFRAEWSVIEKNLRAVKKELRQVVTIPQEGILFRHAILRQRR